MGGYEGVWCGFGWWWIFPIVMIALCIFMMRGRMCSMMGWPTSRSADGTGPIASSDSAGEILDKRYALGEISKELYNEVILAGGNPIAFQLPLVSNPW